MGPQGPRPSSGESGESLEHRLSDTSLIFDHAWATEQDGSQGGQRPPVAANGRRLGLQTGALILLCLLAGAGVQWCS